VIEHGATSDFLLRLAAAVLVSASGAACGHADAGDDPPPVAVPVTCTVARSGPVSDTVTLYGVVATPPEGDVLVASQVAGRVSRVKVHEGDTVTAGDLLAVVDDPSLSAGVDQAVAAAAAARVALTNANTALARTRSLFKRGLAPKSQLDEAVSRQAQAAADRRATAARRVLSYRQGKRSRVRSPLSGVVVELLRRPGELVDGTAGTPLLEIADMSKLELRADASPADLVRVSRGDTVEVTLGALPDQPLRGTVVFVSPAVSPKTMLGEVRAELAPAPEGVHLKLGLTGSMTLQVHARRGKVLVPASAIRRSSDGTQALVVCAGEGDELAAEVRTVLVGGRAGADVEISRGVGAGERVVTRHVVGLEDGTRIRAAKAPAAPATSAP
jgi:RND family efflux transporter MFP subunit